MTTIRNCVVSLAMARMRPQDIALKLNVSRTTVYAHIREARLAGADIPAFPNGRKGPAENAGAPPPVAQQRHLVVPMRLHSLLVQRAEERGVTPTELAQKMLEKELLGTVARHD